MLNPDKEEHNRILQLAERLGYAIGDSPLYRQLQEIDSRLDADNETKQLLLDYQLLAKRFEEKSANKEEATSEQIRLKRLLERRIRENPLILEFLRAQADFAELMASVRKTLQEAIGTKLKTEI
jgi:cell fate (sporulation/competence/biofilm development) regulator YlbF (YheA/YmcA/DUF963 family)